jgi:hypothetical protein
MTKQNYQTETILILHSFSNLHSSSLSKRDKEKNSKALPIFLSKEDSKIGWEHGKPFRCCVGI